jgi:hypothetical protein
MLRYAGKIAKIERLTTAGYFRLDRDIGYDWADWMFDPDYDPTREPLPAKDAAQAMLDGETLYDKDGKERLWDEFNCSFNSYGTNDVMSTFDGLYRRPVKRKRPMNRYEILDWANSDKSRGWVICNSNTKPTSEFRWYCPQYLDYACGSENYWKARFLPDLSEIDESTIQQFLVEE